MQRIKDAARLATGGYPGGLVALCARFGFNYETTRKELAGTHGYKMDADKLLLMSQVCIEAGGEHCRAILNAWIGAHDEVQHANEEAKPLMLSTVDLVSSSSDVLRAVTEARSDKVISDNERKTIERAANTVKSNMDDILRAVARENEASKLHRVA